MITIYKATCVVNNKSYIGIDSYWPHRKSDHKRNALIYQQKFIFYNAIRKYGWDNFSWEVLFQCSDEQYNYALSVMEPHFIAEYTTLAPNGYNMTLGGDGVRGYKMSDDRKAQISEQMKKQQRTEESNNKRSATLTGIKRKPFTKEHKSKLIATKVKSFVVTFPNGDQHTITNLRNFCRENNLDPGTMSAVAHGKRHHKSHKGFRCSILE